MAKGSKMPKSDKTDTSKKDTQPDAAKDSSKPDADKGSDKGSKSGLGGFGAGVLGGKLASSAAGGMGSMGAMAGSAVGAIGIGAIGAGKNAVVGTTKKVVGTGKEVAGAAKDKTSGAMTAASEALYFNDDLSRAGGSVTSYLDNVLGYGSSSSPYNAPVDEYVQREQQEQAAKTSKKQASGPEVA